MKKIILGFFLLSFCTSTWAGLSAYGSGTIGYWGHKDSSKSISLEKYGGAIGAEYKLFSILSLGAELQYSQGVALDPLPKSLEGKVKRGSYGSFEQDGVNLVKVRYFDLWLRPKVLLPLPFVSPYLAVPINPIGYGGMQGYMKYSFGIAALLGVDIEIMSLRIFLESGIAVKRSGKDHSSETPPWQLTDYYVPITLGLGYNF